MISLHIILINSKVVQVDKKAIEKLKQEVEEVKDISSLNWLREKITELE